MRAFGWSNGHDVLFPSTRAVPINVPSGIEFHLERSWTASESSVHSLFDADMDLSTLEGETIQLFNARLCFLFILEFDEPEAL